MSIDTSALPRTVKTTCSGCSVDVTVDTRAETVSAKIPSNGIRGKGHKPAHAETVDLGFEGTDGQAPDLLTWDCPKCGYADSFDPNH